MNPIPLPNGDITMWLCGKYGPVPRWEAVQHLLHIQDSPYSQTLSNQLRAALQEKPSE